MTYKTMTSIAVLAFLSLGCGSGSSTGGLNAEQTFTIALNSAQEVPTPQATSATGVAEIIVYPSEIEFQLSAINITGIRMAHIHSGAIGVAGPIVVTLFLPATATGSVSGVFARGTLNSTNLPASVTIESLKTLLASGSSYVDVHTTANPAGEIRGQLR